MLKGYANILQTVPASCLRQIQVICHVLQGLAKSKSTARSDLLSRRHLLLARTPHLHTDKRLQLPCVPRKVPEAFDKHVSTVRLGCGELPVRMNF